VIGILLAAGKGSRFAPSGLENKLLQALGTDCVASAAARNLLAVLPRVVAVVRPGTPVLAQKLRAAGCQVIECAQAEQGMGASLAYALSQAAEAQGWVVALADMPWVRPQTIASLAAAIRAGAGIAQPLYRGQRGNPVAFSRRYLPQLQRLSGDQGARALLKTEAVEQIAVDDPGIVRDIDTPADLRDQAPEIGASPPHS